jgi:hypothetical protein
MTWSQGDKVTVRQIWLEATITEAGDHQSTVRWRYHAFHGFPEFSTVPNSWLVSWEEAQKEMGEHVVDPWRRDEPILGLEPAEEPKQEAKPLSGLEALYK